VSIGEAGDYRVVLNLGLKRTFEYEPARCTVVFKVDGQERFRREFIWETIEVIPFPIDVKWEPGEHRFTLEVHPQANESKQKPRALDVRFTRVVIQGPLDRARWVHPTNYERFFPRDEPPSADPERQQYAREILTRFTTKAYRRPVDPATLDRLMTITNIVWKQPNKTFEQGVAQAMVAVLASPGFLFRNEEPDPAETGKAHALVDEYALASRLSYFLWSSMPDDELFAAAEKGELRKNLASQVERMLKDPRSAALVENFAGQWLQLRDVDQIPVNVNVALKREGSTAKVQLDAALRQAMRRESELLFNHILREDRTVLDLIDSDYTFLNERLANHYGIPGVTGSEMRKVNLPPDSVRGGVLTHASVLMVTSNPERTSPVKRGLFIMDNILGTPGAPAPPEVPDFEETEKQFKDREPTVREVMELHRAKPLCSACHSRMDPLGLSLENFNALGMYREQERGQAVDASGRLITGESINSASDVKRVLKNERRGDFYRCLTEKLLTYALGRGLEYYDVPAVDGIVERLEKANGRFSALLTGVIESVPFQKRRNVAAGTGAAKSAESTIPNQGESER
jgi:hypothetical protein